MNGKILSNEKLQKASEISEKTFTSIRYLKF